MFYCKHMFLNKYIILKIQICIWDSVLLDSQSVKHDPWLMLDSKINSTDTIVHGIFYFTFDSCINIHSNISST